MKNENFEHCLSIAKELEKIAAGELFKCPECGEWIAEADCEYNEAHDVITCECGADLNSEDLEPVSMWDYFEDALDIDYVINSRKEYQACRIMIACGGPNIYVNTWDKRVELYWWTESAEANLSYRVCDEINEYFSELWTCL